jgi:hypothetical protein
MFEGNRECSVCGKELAQNERNFGLSLKGLTYVFCDSCIKGRKDQVRRMLHDEKS